MITSKEIVDFLISENQEIEYYGNINFEVMGYCSLKKMRKNCITWIKEISDFSIQDIKKLPILIVCKKIEIKDKYLDMNFIFCEHPKEIFFSILNHFYATQKSKTISESAIVESNNIGKNCNIGAGSYVGKEVILGDNVFIGCNVVIENKVIIEEKTIIHSGAVIGKDGFGYYKNEEGISIKVPHFGGVKIGKNVEIGANCCIDRGTLDDTIIEDYVKIDNMCHIAHNCHIGKFSKIVALTLLGGSVNIGKESYIAPGCMIKNQVSIGDKCVIGMGAMVLKDVEDERVAIGYPAKIIRTITENDMKL